MLASCITIVAGATLIALPTQAMTLRWVHTVEKTIWEEDYAASADGVTITEARIETFGAGMEPPDSAIWDGHWWRYRPNLPTLTSVQLANSIFAAGYTLCWSSSCRPLSSIVRLGEPVSMTSSPCTDAVVPAEPRVK